MARYRAGKLPQLQAGTISSISHYPLETKEQAITILATLKMFAKQFIDSRQNGCGKIYGKPSKGNII